MLRVGDSFPEFELQDQDGKSWSHIDLVGSPSIVYFYPKDDTPGCTKEACDAQAQLPKFDGAKVFGVSPDSVKSHQKFAKKYGLEFPLLADTERALCKACGVWGEKTLAGKLYLGVRRTTFLLDEDGKVSHVWENVKVSGHIEDILSRLV